MTRFGSCFGGVLWLMILWGLILAPGEARAEVVENTVIVYRVQTDPVTRKETVVEKFEWLDLARWYRFLSFLPSLPTVSDALAPPLSPEHYTVIETNKYGEPTAQIDLSGGVMAISQTRATYKFYHDVKELQSYINSLLEKNPHSTAPHSNAPALFQVLVWNGKSQELRLTIHDTDQATTIAALLHNLPEVKVMDAMSYPVDFRQDGTITLRKMAGNTLSGLPQECDIADHEIRFNSRWLEAMRYRDRNNFSGEIQNARKLRDLLKAQGLPLRKTY